MILADLFLKGLRNSSQYTAILVVMAGYSRFVRTYVLKANDKFIMNVRMKEYIARVERQKDRHVTEMSMMQIYVIITIPSKQNKSILIKDRSLMILSNDGI